MSMDDLLQRLEEVHEAGRLSWNLFPTCFRARRTSKRLAMPSKWHEMAVRSTCNGPRSSCESCAAKGDLEALSSVIDLEEERLEAEKQRQLRWADELQMASVSPPPEAAAKEEAPVEAPEVQVEVEEVIHPPPRRASVAAPKGLAAFMKRAVVRWTRHGQARELGNELFLLRFLRKSAHIDSSPSCFHSSRVPSARLYTCLALALFTPGMVTLLNLPDEPTVMIQDILFCLIGVAFALARALEASQSPPFSMDFGPKRGYMAGDAGAATHRRTLQILLLLPAPLLLEANCC